MRYATYNKVESEEQKPGGERSSDRSRERIYVALADGSCVRANARCIRKVCEAVVVLAQVKMTPLLTAYGTHNFQQQQRLIIMKAAAAPLMLNMI